MSEAMPEMHETLDGGCLCGRIRYRISAQPIDAGYCHCRLCQRSSGAPCLAWLTVAAGNFAYRTGTAAVYRSSAHSHREFCAVCGSQLVFRKSVDPKTVDVTMASLDDPSRVRPEYHIWRWSRIKWFETDDTLPRHEQRGPDRHEA